MITMKHNLAYIEAKAFVTELDFLTRSHLNFDDTYQIFIRSRCPVDRVFRNSEVLLYISL